MSISATKSFGPSLASFGSLGSVAPSPAAGNVAGLAGGVDQALKALSQNPIVRSLLGESAFEGVQGAGKTGQAAQAGNPQELLQKVLDTLKQLVSVLETLSGKKAGEGAQQAGGAEGAQGAQAPQGGQQAGGAEGAQGAQGPEAEEEKDPIKKLLKVLEQIMQAISQLQQKLGAQGPQQAAAPTGGAEAPAAPAQG
jgi:hypothetical protein